MAAITTTSPYDDILKEWSTSQEKARLTNMKREQQITSIYDEIIRRYQPGGTFGRAALGQLKQQKIRDVGGETQQMISSGMYGTTTAANLGNKWEATTGQPARLRLEDLQMERLSGAQTSKASFMERVDTPYPDYSLMSQLLGQFGQGGGGQFGGGGASGGWGTGNVKGNVGVTTGAKISTGFSPGFEGGYYGSGGVGSGGSSGGGQSSGGGGSYVAPTLASEKAQQLEKQKSDAFWKDVTGTMTPPGLPAASKGSYWVKSGTRPDGSPMWTQAAGGF